MRRVSRRSFLQQGLALAGLSGCAHGMSGSFPLSRRAGLTDPFAMAPGDAFPVGVSSGDVAPGAARLVSRYTGPRPVEWWLFHADDLVPGAPPEPRMRIPVDVGDGAMVSAGVDGLMPATRHAYALVGVDDAGRPAERSVLGQFITAPLPDARPPLTFTASACARQRFGFEPLLRAAQVDGAFHVLLGDTSYNDGARTLEEYRAAWQGTLSRGEYVALRSSTSVLASWDDHEVENNWYPGGTDPAQRDAAVRAYMDFVPVREDPGGFRLWRSSRWGRTAELFVLDLYSEQDRAADRFISRTQMDWLKRSLKASPCTFKIVVTSLPISTLPFPANLYRPGRWAGFPDQRAELLETTRDVPGTFFLAGDVHMPGMGRVDLWGEGKGQLEVLVGPSAHQLNPLWHTLLRPQWDWAGGFANIAAVHLEPADSTVTVTFVDAAGRERVSHAYRV